jgi:hypothetical protein
LLYFEAILFLPLFLSSLIYFPNQPKFPPNKVA